MKYWLIAVSSAVRTSLSRAMMLGSPCTAVDLRRCIESVVPGSERDRGLEHEIGRPRVGEHRSHRGLTAAASCGRAARRLDGFECRRAVLDRTVDRALPNRFAVTDDCHDGPLWTDLSVIS